MRASSLGQLLRVRERQRDAAREALGAARAAERRFDEQRRGWRRLVAPEQQVALEDQASFAGWLEACRVREWGTAERAAELARRVRAAEDVQRHADLAVERLARLTNEAHRRERRAAEAKTQRALDDFRRPTEEGATLVDC